MNSEPVLESLIQSVAAAIPHSKVIDSNRGMERYINVQVDVRALGEILQQIKCIFDTTVNIHRFRDDVNNEAERLIAEVRRLNDVPPDDPGDPTAKQRVIQLRLNYVSILQGLVNSLASNNSIRD